MRPLVAPAVDAYLQAYIDAAVLLGAEWIVVHAGFHFSADIPQRMQAALDRLRRVADYAERKSVLLLLENLNKEPEQAEVHYLAHTIDEWRWFYDKIESPALQLSFTANHAHLVPEGVDGLRRRHAAGPGPRSPPCRLLQKRSRTALNPGQGDFDFPALFNALETREYTGHYMNAFGSLDDMLKARALFAGIATG